MIIMYTISTYHPYTYTHTLSLSLSHTHTLTLFLTHPLTHTHTHIHTHTHTHTHSLSLSHTHTHTHTYIHTHTHTHTLGTTLSYHPGLLEGGTLEHDCSRQRSIGYFLEPLMMLAPFTKKPVRITLRGLTNGPDDPSVRNIA